MFWSVCYLISWISLQYFVQVCSLVIHFLQHIHIWYTKARRSRKFIFITNSYLSLMILNNQRWNYELASRRRMFIELIPSRTDQMATMKHKGSTLIDVNHLFHWKNTIFDNDTGRRIFNLKNEASSSSSLLIQEKGFTESLLN